MLEEAARGVGSGRRGAGGHGRGAGGRTAGGRRAGGRRAGGRGRRAGSGGAQVGGGGAGDGGEGGRKEEEVLRRKSRMRGKGRKSASPRSRTCSKNTSAEAVSFNEIPRGLLSHKPFPLRPSPAMEDPLCRRPRALHFILHLLPAAAFDVLWSFALSSLVVLCALYAIRCACRFDCFKAELGHHVGVNYLFAPWASALLLLQCAPSPFLRPERPAYHVLWWAFAVPILVLDVKVYGQWFTKGRKYCLSAVANPTSQMTVIANMAAAAAAAAATTDLKEIATCMFTVGLAHYLVLFVTLYQRLAGSESLLPALLRRCSSSSSPPRHRQRRLGRHLRRRWFRHRREDALLLSFFLFLCLVRT
uniref:Uncharacterized protein n=1 Tax=Ananas comosus var. bracteatus TaxID=296719 RepID=A0A6V7NY18_ANACO|nr:unnamed protein product [Ananas comosus var. bracteatus]